MYKRVKNIEEKIHSAKLPYNAWKVFFLIDGSVGLEQIAEYLEEEMSVVDEAIQRLIKDGLIESAGSEAEAEQETVELSEEFEEQVTDEILAEEESVPEEEPEFEMEPEIETEESLEMDLDEELAEVADEPVSEEDLAEDEGDLTDDLISVVDEEEAEVPEDEEVEEESLTDFSLENFDMDETAEVEAASEIEIESESGAEEETLEIDLQDMDTKTEEDFEGSDLNIDFVDEQTEETAVKEAEPVIAEPKQAPSEISADTKTILVVDDSIVIRKMVEIALEDENYRIETAVSGKDGLAILDDKNPNLMILDLMLPDINGIDLLKTVKASKGIPVIMLSGKDSPQLVEKARSEGADAFLPKPFKDDELVAKIRELLS